MNQQHSLPGHRDIWRIAMPMIISNISVPLLGMVDTGVTGHLGNAAYLAAVAVGATIFAFIYGGFNFLRMGTTGIAAQRFGANDYAGIKQALGQSIIVGLIIAAVMLVLQKPIAQVAMTLISPDGDVIGPAEDYFYTRVWSAPATLANYALIGWFLGLQNARIPLYIVLTINITNIVLDLWFVNYLGMQIKGVALASVIAEFSGVSLAAVFALRELKKYPGHFQPQQLFSLKEYKGFFSVNTNLLIRTMALMLAFGVLTAAGARLGKVVLAANTVLLNFLHLTSFALDGLAQAAEALVGKATGARNRQALRQAVNLSLRWSLICAVLFSVCYFFFMEHIVYVLTDLPDVIAETRRYHLWIVLMPVVAVWSYLYDGVFVGATRTREMRNIMLISTFLVFVPCIFIFKAYGNHGLWFALILFMASRGVGMYYYYQNNILGCNQTDSV